jgi:hypothetical protein
MSYTSLFLCIALIFVLFVSGCTSNNIFGTTNIADISKNPVNYINTTVKIQGALTILLHLSPPAIDWKHYLVDAQGYQFHVELPSENREFYVGEKYELLGKIQKIEYCYCQRRYVDVEGDFVNFKVYDYIKRTIQFLTNFTCDNPVPILDVSGEWQRTTYSNNKEVSSSCTSKKETIFICSYNYQSETYQDSFKDKYRCDPDTIEVFYYLESVEATKI